MMNIQPIRTKADHKAALKLVSRLVDLDLAPRTPDGDLLDVMSTVRVHGVPKAATPAIGAMHHVR